MKKALIILLVSMVTVSLFAALPIYGLLQYESWDGAEQGIHKPLYVELGWGDKLFGVDGSYFNLYLTGKRYEFDNKVLDSGVGIRVGFNLDRKI